MKTILQVEDDPNDVFFLKHALKRAGVANPIRVVSDGREAMDYLKGAGRFSDREQFPLPGLVLLDLKLPHVMGLDVLKWIRRESGLSLVVVLLTASAEEADIASAYRLGANGFLVKPCEANKLVEMAKAINDFWLTHTTLPRTPYLGGSPSASRSKRLSTVNGTPRARLPNDLKPARENAGQNDSLIGVKKLNRKLENAKTKTTNSRLLKQ
jgi:two-component system response regulator